MVEAPIATAEIRQTQELQPPEQSLFDHYSVAEEIEFLKRMNHLPLEEQQFYIHENILGFLGEYAGKIPYKKISYILRNGSLYYTGIKMLDMYKKTLEIAPIGSREHYEIEGMRQIEKAFAGEYGAVNTATVLSPPKIDNYSFAFHFVKGLNDSRLQGIPVTTYVLQYPERMGAIANSKKIAKAISLDANIENSYNTTTDFLMGPFLAYNSDSKQELERLLQITGIDKEAIKKSQLFEGLVQKEMKEWMEQYFNNIYDLSHMYPGTDEYRGMEKEAEKLLGALYNRSRELKERIDNSLQLGRIHITSEEIYTSFVKTQVSYHSFDLQEINYYAQKQPLTVTGGSCPVTKRRDGISRYLSSFDIQTALSSGITLDTLFSVSGDEKDWDYHTGDCVVCRTKNTDVGPCNICKTCEKTFD